MILKVISNLDLKSKINTTEYGIAWTYFDFNGGAFFKQVYNIVKILFRYNAIVINCGGKYLVLLCYIKKIWPFIKPKLILLEWNGVRPVSAYQRLAAEIKKFGLSSVDLFLLLIKDVSGFETYYGIDPDKCQFIPFKVNKLSLISRAVAAEEDYILSCGNRRDYKLVTEAVKGLPYKVIILRPPRAMEKTQGTEMPLQNEIPSNVEVIDHDGSSDTWINYIAGCKLLVIPISEVCIYAEGVSTYLEAMALNKCVITTLYEGTRGIIDSGQAILVPRGDFEALREAISRAWNDDEYRHSIAACGYKYAMSLGGDVNYYSNIIRYVREFLL
jgi:glycosyltransferase involved in cell wall biosynthesis